MLSRITRQVARLPVARSAPLARSLYSDGEYQNEPFTMIPGVEPKVCSAEDAMGAVLASHQTVFLHTAAATPTILVDAMADVGYERGMKGIDVCHLHTEGPLRHTQPGMEETFSDISFFTGGNSRKAIAEGRAHYAPMMLSEIPILFRREIQPVDVALLQVSPPDRHGYVSLGVSVDVSRAAAQFADKIVAVVNPNMPRTFGDGSMHVSHIDYLVESNDPIFSASPRAPTAAEEAIGDLIAENLVKDGSTLQMGIGSIPDSVLRACHSHSGLGVHTEMFSDQLLPLLKKGVVTNQNKKSHAGKTVSSFVVGSTELYDFLDDNPSVAMLDVQYTNDPSVIRRQPGMTAINSCIEIDLTGQVASDSIGTRIYSGIGGQLDFIRGASLAEDGVAILAMPATTSRGESKIVPVLKPGAGVVTTRAHVHYIVTEFGIAELYGKTLVERAKALISIAAPEHREELCKQASDRLNYVITTRDLDI